MLTLLEEKREKAKSLLTKVIVIIALTVLFACFSYFTIASKIIRSRPVKSYSSVSQSISNIPEKISDTDTKPQGNKVVDKNDSMDNFSSTFFKNIAISNVDNFSGNEQNTSSTQEQGIETLNQNDISQEGNNSNSDNNSSGNTSIDDTSSESFTAALLHMINTARLENGLPALNANPAINVVAQHRSQDMIDRNYFSHQTPEGKDISSVLQEFGVMFAACGENIQYASPPSWANPGLFFNSWMDSDLHRANILNGNFSQIGIGISNNNDRLIAVLVFIN
jgi:uncharacterized protein YkwD